MYQVYLVVQIIGIQLGKLYNIIIDIASWIGSQGTVNRDFIVIF